MTNISEVESPPTATPPLILMDDAAIESLNFQERGLAEADARQWHDEHASRGENRWFTCPWCDDEAGWE